ncbi:MAG: cache domain-containing protein, partial [Cellvibrionaceae bacterium]|nr:cache domain-containing protein [Cellvibrionaceae bacterium]
MSIYKGIEIPDKLDGIIDHMPVLESAREQLSTLGQQWDFLTILGQMSGSGTDMSGTRQAFQDLTSELLAALGVETLRKTVNSMTSIAQVTVDIVIRNLFERTADIGFLATDDDIRAFLRETKDTHPGSDDRRTQMMRRRFSEYVSNYSVYKNIVLLDCNGQLLCQLDDSNPLQCSSDAIIGEALKTNEDFVETYRYSDLSPRDEKSLMYCFRVTETNTSSSSALGVLCLVFDFEDEMQGVFQQLLSEDDWAVLSLLDSEGRVIACSDQCQIPLGSAVEVVEKSEFKVTRFAGRLYLSKTCVTKGYQGFNGLGWRGHAMIPIEHAFKDSASKAAQAIPDEVMSVIMENSALFAKELHEISESAEQIQSELDQTVWNGNLLKDGDQSDSRSISKKVLLSEVSTTGSKTKNIFENSIHRLHQTVVNTILGDAEFCSCLAIDIMDRNLYERANDCRWWALTTMFRKTLAQTSLDKNQAGELESILKYINALYTVYTNLFIYDAQGKIIAVSNDSQKHMLGNVLTDAYVKQTLAIRSSQVYSVSPFDASELYDGKPTYIYGAVITDLDNPQRALGGIGIVFDSEPEFKAMLEDSLPKTSSGEVLAGYFGVLCERGGKVISSSCEQLPPGATLDIERSLFNLANGSTAKKIIEYRNQYYALGVAASTGYREYKGESDSYQNDILCFTFIPLGEYRSAVQRSQLPHRAIRVSHRVKELGVNYREFATFYIGQSWLGVDVAQVEQSLSIADITAIPTKNPALAGSIMYRDKPIAIVQARGSADKTD